MIGFLSILASFEPFLSASWTFKTFAKAPVRLQLQACQSLFLQLSQILLIQMTGHRASQGFLR
jgi:hypothetical protein